MYICIAYIRIYRGLVFKLVSPTQEALAVRVCCTWSRIDSFVFLAILKFWETLTLNPKP